jgi:hypothetical protein
MLPTIVAKKHDAAAERLTAIVDEFAAALDGEEITAMRWSKIRRDAELAFLAEITRASAIAGEALISSVVDIEATAEKAKREAGGLLMSKPELETIIEKDGAALIKQLVSRAKSGDSASLRMCIDRSFDNLLGLS